jgi:hypothetical protein
MPQFLPASFTWWVTEKELADLNLFEKQDKSA